MAIITNETKQKLAPYKDYFLKVYPNREQQVNPDFDAGQPVGENNQPLIPYTDAQWFEEVVKRFLKEILKRGQQLIQVEALTQDSFDDVN